MRYLMIFSLFSRTTILLIGSVASIPLSDSLLLHGRSMGIAPKRRYWSSQNSNWGSASLVDEKKLKLPSGPDMQILTTIPSASENCMPPVIFLHGSFHAAWCWTEHFFPFFSSKGYPVIALSWRGTDGTKAGPAVRKVKISEHVSDLLGVLDLVPEIMGIDEKVLKPPILVAHSFGGLVIMKALEASPQLASNLSGVAMICSVPPSGNGKMTMRYLRRSLIDSYKITVGFAMKRCLNNEDLCRELFFGGRKQLLANGSWDEKGVSDEDIRRYQDYFRRDSTATIDLLDLAKKLPSAKTINGRAPFVEVLPPCLVLGASDDFIVDKEAVQETACYFGVKSPVFINASHDVMLGNKWENAASELFSWMEGIV